MSAISTGFIGLGSQGGGIAEAMMKAGHPLTIWARRAEVVEEWLEKGASAAASIAELGAACDHVGVCVVDDAGVAQICDELIPEMREGSLLAIHSTILPESCEALEARCAEREIAFLDAPVSGGGQAALDKTLTLMCGGAESAFEQASPVLSDISGMLVLLGPAGSGQRAKIANNALMAANMGLAHAAAGAAAKLGVDRAAFLDLVKASSGRSFGFEVYARLPSPQAFAQGAPLLAKDVGLLASVLGDDEDAATLKAAARHFLDPATSQA
ncbi:MAG: NAD(P)-dependent oxidoreductase [Sphingomonadaceae bacterium]